MKNILRLLLLPALMVTLLWSCKKDENKIYLESGTPPVLTASSTAPIVLTDATKENLAMKFDWTNPDYRFTTGVSSQDVTYVLQIDTAGANFTNPSRQEISLLGDLGITFTVKELNTVISKMDLLENVPHNMEFRLKASLAGNAVPLFSNVVKRTVTPYLDVVVPVPANGNLWIVGDATANGWSNPLPAPFVNSQKFTRISSSLYELTLAMPGGGNYKLLQDNGVWGTQYHMLTGGTWSGGEFEMKDSDPGFPGPPSAGTYKITVNFKTGKYTVVKL